MSSSQSPKFIGLNDGLRLVSMSIRVSSSRRDRCISFTLKPLSSNLSLSSWWLRAAFKPWRSFNCINGHFFASSCIFGKVLQSIMDQVKWAGIGRRVFWGSFNLLFLAIYSLHCSLTRAKNTLSIFFPCNMKFFWSSSDFLPCFLYLLFLDHLKSQYGILSSAFTKSLCKIQFLLLNSNYAIMVGVNFVFMKATSRKKSTRGCQ